MVLVRELPPVREPLFLLMQFPARASAAGYSQNQRMLRTFGKGLVRGGVAVACGRGRHENAQGVVAGRESRETGPARPGRIRTGG